MNSKHFTYGLLGVLALIVLVAAVSPAITGDARRSMLSRWAVAGSTPAPTPTSALPTTFDASSLGAQNIYATTPARAPPACGNDVVEVGEACDEGILNGVAGKCNFDCSGINPPLASSVQDNMEQDTWKITTDGCDNNDARLVDNKANSGTHSYFLKAANTNVLNTPCTVSMSKTFFIRNQARKEVKWSRFVPDSVGSNVQRLEVFINNVKVFDNEYVGGAVPRWNTTVVPLQIAANRGAAPNAVEMKFEVSINPVRGYDYSQTGGYVAYTWIDDIAIGPLCGDNFVDEGEVCDGGAGCFDCICYDSDYPAVLNQTGLDRMRVTKGSCVDTNNNRFTDLCGNHDYGVREAQCVRDNPQDAWQCVLEGGVAGCPVTDMCVDGGCVNIPNQVFDQNDLICCSGCGAQWFTGACPESQPGCFRRGTDILKPWTWIALSACDFLPTDCASYSGTVASDGIIRFCAIPN